MTCRLFSVDYCSVVVPKKLWDEESVPEELKYSSTEEYPRLKNGIEVSHENLYELINNSPDFAAINSKWRDFLREVIATKADVYIFGI